MNRPRAPLVQKSLLALLALGLATLGAQEPPRKAEPIAMPTPREYAEARAASLVTPKVVEVSATEFRAKCKAMAERAAADKLAFATLVKGFRGEVEPAFTWVRDQVAYAAYPGILRGAESTLQARVGNAADRALLLATFLEQSGFETRFAFGELQEDVARKLVLRTLEARPGDAPASRLPALVAGDFVTELGARARRDFAAFAMALGTLPDAAKPGLAPQLLAAVRNHVWLQAKTEKGWTDLDPSFVDAKPGETLCAVATTRETLPDDLRHWVTIRVVVEMLEHEKLVRSTALEERIPAHELAGHDVFLMHVPAVPGASVGGLFVPQKQGEWSPTLYLDGKLRSGKAVAFDPVKPGTNFGTLGGALGGATGESGPPFVAEWLELEFAAPGRTPTPCRRPLVDRAPPLLRAKGSLRKDDLVPLERDAEGQPTAPQELHGLVFGTGSHDLAGWTRALSEIAEEYDDTATPTSRPSSNPRAGGPFETLAREMAHANRSWELLSDALVVPALNARADLRFYVDAPRLWIFTIGTLARGHFVRTDVVRHELGVLATTPEAEAQVAAHRLWLGILEGALEHAVLARRVVQLFGPEAKANSASAACTPSELLVLRPSDVAKLDALVPQAEIAFPLRKSLTEGATVVVGKTELAAGRKLADAGWWELRPNGDFVALLGGVYGGALAELAPAGGSQWPGVFRSADMMKRRPIAVHAHKVGGREYESLVARVRSFIMWNAEYFAYGCLASYAVSIYAWFH